MNESKACTEIIVKISDSCSGLSSANSVILEEKFVNCLGSLLITTYDNRQQQEFQFMGDLLIEDL